MVSSLIPVKSQYEGSIINLGFIMDLGFRSEGLITILDGTKNLVAEGWRDRLC